MLGEPMPVAAPLDWMRGRAWPDAPNTALENGFEQLGWRIDLSRFADGVLIATRIAAPTVVLRARIEKQAATLSTADRRRPSAIAFGTWWASGPTATTCCHRSSR